jgi:hypothetical protein
MQMLKQLVVAAIVAVMLSPLLSVLLHAGENTTPP